ncbi:MAG: hypothetical protein ACE5G0_07520 [Rhodothermales bacterium]
MILPFTILPFAVLAFGFLALGGTGFSTFFWMYTRDLKAEMHQLRNRLQTQDKSLAVFDQRVQDFKLVSQRYEASFRRIAEAVDNVSLIQNEQSLEIKRLHRRKLEPLLLGIEPRTPDLIPVPNPRKRNLAEGPKTLPVREA